MSTSNVNMATGEQQTGEQNNNTNANAGEQTPVKNGGKEDRVDREDKQGGKRKSKRKPNKFLKAWTSFVAKVQKEEGIAKYSDAIKRAKVRKDKGEKWMGGQNEMGGEPVEGGQNEMGRQGGRRQRKTNKRSRKQRRNSSKR